MISRQSWIALFILICTSAAFAAEPKSPPISPPAGAHLQTPSRVDSLAFAMTNTLAEPSGIVTLAQVQAYALMHDPRLESFAWEQGVSEARRLQAGTYSNPEIGFDIENGPGTGELRGFDNAEQTLQVSQLIELGGKRQQRLNVSRHEQDLARWDYEAARLDVLNDVTQRFYETLAAQERIMLAEENSRLTEDVLATATKRVQTGIASADEEMKARLAVSLSHIEKDRAERTLVSTKIQLAATWGSTQPMFDGVQDGFDTLTSVPAYERLIAHIDMNPDLARWNAELARRKSVLKLEKAGQLPDVTLAAGVRRFSAGENVAMVMGASVPIPIFNTNQGNVRAAHLGLFKGQTEQRSTALQATKALSNAYRNLSSAFNEAAKLKSEVLPEAQRVFEAAGEKYRQGKSSYLEVLDAQRTVVDVRGRYVDALESYHMARADVERLIGIGLDNVNATQDEK